MIIHHEPVFIIAEAGVNHDGSLVRAKEMVKAAAKTGVNAIKFQTFSAEVLVTKKADKADYQKRISCRAESQFAMLKKLELSRSAHLELIQECKSNNIEFLSSPFDLIAIDLLEELGITKWKIPSGEITNLPYLKKIASLGSEIILSTGMADLDEIEAALSVFTTAGIRLGQITVLHCNTEYPTPIQDVNLRAMLTIKEAFPGVKIGYSDHTLGIEIPIAAVAMGATVIEKHFTLDETLPGPDHKASLSLEELAQMVNAVRHVEKALGNGIKAPSASEKKNIEVVRKSLVAACKIDANQLFTKDNLTAKRPGTGISPMKWNEVVGKRASKDYEKDDLIDA